MEINRNNVIEIVQKSGLKPDKDYGQNYLLEPSICEKIVDALNISKEDVVLEIGPGLGSLTHFISLHEEAQIDLVDIDERMINFLKILYQQKNISIIRNDIRKHNVSKYTKIIGNLPYNITTETIVYLLENAKNVKRMVLMCQQEAFPRFSDVSGKEYGPASILVHLLGECRKLFTVKPGSFYPIPKCNSVVFSIDVKENVDYQEALNIYHLSKKLFLNRRKTIYNNLSNCIPNKEMCAFILDELGIPQNKRPEELSPEIYRKLYERIK